MSKIPSPCGLGEELGALFDEVEALGVQAQTLATQLQNADASTLASLVGNVASTMIAQNTGLMVKADAFSSTVSGISPPSLLDEVFDKVKTLENVLSQPGLDPLEKTAALLKFADDMDLLQGKYAEKMTEYGIDLTKLVDVLQTGDITPKMLCDILPNVSILPDGSSLEKALPIEFPEIGINDILDTANDVVANAQSKLLQVDKMLTAPASLRLLVGGDPSSDVINSVKNMLPSGTAKNLLSKEITNLTSSYNKAADFIADLTDFSSSDVKTKSISELVTTVKSNEDRLDPPDDTGEPALPAGTLYMEADPSYQPQNYTELLEHRSGKWAMTITNAGHIEAVPNEIDGDPGTDGQETHTLDQAAGWYQLLVSSPTVSSTSKRTATAMCYLQRDAALGSAYSYKVLHAFLIDVGNGYTEIPEFKLESGLFKRLLPADNYNLTFPEIGTNYENNSSQAGATITNVITQPTFSGVAVAGEDVAGEPSVMDKIADLIEEETGTRPDWADLDGGGTGAVDWTQYDDDWEPDTSTATRTDFTSIYFLWPSWGDTGWANVRLMPVIKYSGPELAPALINYIQQDNINDGAETKVIGVGYGHNSVDWNQSNSSMFELQRPNGSERIEAGTANWTLVAMYYKTNGNLMIQLGFDFDPSAFINANSGYMLEINKGADYGYSTMLVYLKSLYLQRYKAGTGSGSLYYGGDLFDSNGKFRNGVSMKIVGGTTKPIDPLGQGPRIEFEIAPSAGGFYNALVNGFNEIEQELNDYDPAINAQLGVGVRLYFSASQNSDY
jgi:hypothetical protein